MNLDEEFENLQIENIQLKNQLKDTKQEFERFKKKQRLDKKIIRALIEEKTKLQEFLTNFQKQNLGFKSLFKKILEKNPKLHKPLKSAGLNLETIQIDHLIQDQKTNNKFSQCSNCAYLKTEKKLFEDKVNKELDMLYKQVQTLHLDKQAQSNNQFQSMIQDQKENNQSNVDKIYEKSIEELQKARSKSRELQRKKNYDISFVKENQQLDELLQKYSNGQLSCIKFSLFNNF